MKVIGNEITSLKIISAKVETTEIKLRTVSKHEMALIKVLGNEKTSLKIILAHAETAETTEILEILSKYYHFHFWSNLIFDQPMVLRPRGVGLLKGGQKWHQICCTSPRLRDIVKTLLFSFLVKFDF